MESDSESDLRARFEALKVPVGLPDYSHAQLSPKTATLKRAAVDDDLRKRLQALGRSGSESGTEIDEEELERFLASEDEWFEEFSDPATLSNDIRALVKSLNDAGLPDDFRPKRPTRHDSMHTITSVPNRYTRGSESDADDEGEIISKVMNEVRLERTLTLSDGSRDASVEASECEDEGDDDPSFWQGAPGLKTPPSKRLTLKNDKPGFRTPPSQNIPLDEDNTTPPSTSKPLKMDTDVGHYASLFSSLETPRSLPNLTPTGPTEQLPSAFAKLQGMKALDSAPGSGPGPAPKPPTIGMGTTLGPPPKLDIEGWRSSKDDKPDTWCCICNADAVRECKGCDGDLYCKKCFDEGHPKDDEEMSQHKSVTYPARDSVGNVTSFYFPG